ncbi:sensor histidine kinase [Pedobacter jejuensis]|uniref:histidine kinase n=1 Tax=Pedobacter jejuensis TaxID=1268550 RepID=A0A3N0BWB3_9SPHI|nr:HAMP domain-containing sensor histidine kinase [Pedobacter jejuensis]RNL53989.1 sensor histidine kinase [Pedobacter jejuensis]
MFKSIPIVLGFKSVNNKTIWSDLIGSRDSFPLESRIFHSISAGLIFLSAIYFPYNLYAGLYVGSLSALFLCAFFIQQYYYSRFKAKPHSTILFAVIGILIFGVNYFTNSGINGSTDLIWPAYLLLLLAISPYQEHLRWLAIYITYFLFLHLLEFYYPNLVQNPFTAGQGQFIDRITAFPLPVLVIYITIRFIRRSYDSERQAAAEKALAVEESKVQILAQKEQLEQSNIEKDKLMAIISHDLRSPLINIQSYLGMLNSRKIDDKHRLMFETSLLQSTNGAVEMLSNLLHWSKTQMEGLDISLQEINLLVALQSTLDMGQLLASKKEILFVNHISPAINVTADIDVLQLVVRNIITNAIKFTPQGGKIQVNAELVPNECKITISDNGKGIAPDKQEKIFSINAESTYGTNNEKGVGLGLVLCKEFIEKVGGKIEFESNLENGSNFYVYIPA